MIEADFLWLSLLICASKTPLLAEFESLLRFMPVVDVPDSRPPVLRCAQVAQTSRAEPSHTVGSHSIGLEAMQVQVR